MNSVLQEDLEEIVNSNIIDWKNLKDKSIFITGATGLIGSILVKALLIKNKKENLFISLLKKFQAIMRFLMQRAVSRSPEREPAVPCRMWAASVCIREKEDGS